MKKSFLSLMVFVGLSSGTYAQRYFGTATGGWNSMNSLFINPASIGGAHEKIAVSLFSVNVGVDNNLGTISSIGSITNTLKSGDSGAAKSVFTYSGKDQFSMMVPAVEVRAPGVLIAMNEKHALALTTRLRVFNEFNNFNKQLYNIITEPSSVSHDVVSLNIKNFNWTAHMWSEIGLTYGGVVLEQEKFQLKAGATVRYLGGVGYLGLKSKNLDFSYSHDKDSLSVSNSDLEFSSNVASASSTFTNGASGSSLLGGPGGGSGIGADLGVILLINTGGGSEDRADQSGNKYKLAISASVTDIGAIKYKTTYNVNVSGNGTITGSDLEKNVKNYDDFRSYVHARGFNADTGVAMTKVSLPTAMIIGADYNITGKYFVNAAFVASLANLDNFGSRYYNQLTITPRYDSKLLSFGLPITYNTLTNNMRFGLGFRFSGFFMGSDDMMALFSNGQYGFNFYFGGVIPICRKTKSGSSFN